MSMAAGSHWSTHRVSWTGLVRGVSWLVLLGVTGLLVRAEADRPALPEGVALHSDLIYGTAAHQNTRLDVYLPVDPPPPGGRPAVLAIHGGGWRGGSKRDYGRHVARLAQHGYVVVAVDYRLSRPGRPSWPANLEDVRDAVRWIRNHASDYGVDPGRIVALGASAGGHLAALLGTWPEGPGEEAATRDRSGSPTPPRTSARVQAVVDFYGPSDLAALAASRPISASPIRVMLGGEPSPRPEQLREASPVEHVSADDPPTLLIHGLDDAHVPVAQSEELADALERAGVPHRLIAVEKARHGFVFNAGGRDLLPEILSFLKTALGDPAETPES